MRSHFLVMVFGFLLGLNPMLPATATLAEDQAVLSVLTTVDGLNVTHNLDMEQLQELDSTSFVTSTIWTDGEVTFEGVDLDVLLEHLELEDGALELIASNDYFVEIPVADLLGSEALLAYHKDGAPMSRRNKGPLWLVYPYDSDVKYQSETYYARSIWQVVKIKVIP